MRKGRFEEYFLRYRDFIIRIVMKKTGDYQVAQEICQQVFVSFYSSMESITEDLVKAWLIRSTQHAIIDYYRRLDIRKAIFEDGPIHEAGNILVEKSLDACEEEIVHKEFTGRIMNEVKRVNQCWYEVLMLHCVEGMSYAEAAEELGIPETVLRARACRARAYIRKRFGDEYEELR